MNKHTPGPWLSSKFGFQVLTGDSWNTICTLKGGAEWEDGRGKYEPEYEWQNQEANARLIAAAPALLEACAGVWMMLADTGDNELRLIADECRAAIALANGEALSHSSPQRQEAGQ